LSIILANALALGFRNVPMAVFLLPILLIPVMFLKMYLQLLFWVPNAISWDIGTVISAHALLGMLALRRAPKRFRMRRSARSTCTGSISATVPQECNRIEAH
jgi:hypothetical protein